MTKKSAGRRAKTKTAPETFISNEAMESRTFAYLRKLWGQDLSDAEILARVVKLDAAERDRIANAVLGRAVLDQLS